MMGKAGIWRVAGAVAIAAGAMGSAVISAPAAGAQTAPPTLTGETLSVPGGALIPNCSGTGSFSFTASGTATGPYPGTFIATGSGAVSPPGQIASYTATFTIDSAAGEVTGTSTYNGTFSGICYQDSGDFTIAVGSNYQATIHTSQGNYTDQGISGNGVVEQSGSLVGFGEQFASSLTQPVLIEPTSMAQCKNGGYKNFPQFKNQGQCVAYVAQQGGS